MRQTYPILAAIIACAVLSCACNGFLGQEVGHPDSPESATQEHTNTDEGDSIKGYPPRKRRIGGPTDVEWDLDNSFPKSGSLLELMWRSKEVE
jgi:hypothetical protein